MYSGTVVLLFIFVLVGLRAVWYCFLVVSGKSSTVLAVLYCFLTWYTNLGTREQKRNEKSPIQQFVHSSSASAFQNCPSDPMLSGRYKNGKDPMPSSRYKKRTEDLSPFKSSHEGETDRCVLKSGVLAARCLVRLSCTAPSGPEAPRSRGC